MPFGHQFPQLLAHGFTLRDLLGSATRDDLFYTGIRYPRGGGTAGGDTARPRCPPSQPRVPLFGQAGAGVPPVGSRPGAAPRAWQGGSGATPGPRDVRWLWGHRRHLAVSCATTGSGRKDNLGTSRMEEAGCSARSNKHPAAVPSAAASLQPKVQGGEGGRRPQPLRGVRWGAQSCPPPAETVPGGWELCTGDEVGPQGQQRFHPAAGLLQQAAPHRALLRRRVHPAHGQPVAAPCGDTATVTPPPLTTPTLGCPDPLPTASPVPRLRRTPPSCLLEKASWCQRVNSAHASARSLGWKPSYTMVWLKRGLRLRFTTRVFCRLALLSSGST